MTHANLLGIVEPDSEIQQMIHRWLRGITEGFTSRNMEIEDKESSIIADQRRTLSDRKWPQFTWEEISIQALAVNANNFV